MRYIIVPLYDHTGADEAAELAVELEQRLGLALSPYVVEGTPPTNPALVTDDPDVFPEPLVWESRAAFETRVGRPISPAAWRELVGETVVDLNGRGGYAYRMTSSVEPQLAPTGETFAERQSRIRQPFPGSGFRRPEPEPVRMFTPVDHGRDDLAGIVDELGGRFDDAA